MAQENRSGGSDRLVGALGHLGDTLSAQTVGNLLKRHGIPPAPERRPTTTWKECIRTHMDVLVATAFFTAAVGTLGGVVTYSVLFVSRLGTREGQVAGVPPHPTHAWMLHMARNVTMAAWGFLAPGQDLSHDRDGKYCPAFQPIPAAAGVTRVPLPPWSPHLNAVAARWVRAVKEECLTRLLLFGEAALHHALREYMAYSQHERQHQGKGNVLRFPAIRHDPERAGAKCGGVHALAASSNTPSVRLPERCDHTVAESLP